MNNSLSVIPTYEDLREVVGSRVSIRDRDKHYPRIIGVLELDEMGYCLRCYKQGVEEVLIEEDDFQRRAPRLEM